MRGASARVEDPSAPSNKRGRQRVSTSATKEAEPSPSAIASGARNCAATGEAHRRRRARLAFEERHRARLEPDRLKHRRVRGDRREVPAQPARRILAARGELGRDAAQTVPTQPAPPNSATRRPPGFNARAIPRAAASARVIQCSAAFEKTASNVPSNASASPSPTSHSSAGARSRATAIISADASRPTTRAPRAAIAGRQLARPATEIQDGLARRAAPANRSDRSPPATRTPRADRRARDPSNWQAASRGPVVLVLAHALDVRAARLMHQMIRSNRFDSSV